MRHSVVAWHPAADGRSGSSRPAANTPGTGRAPSFPPLTGLASSSRSALEPNQRAGKMDDGQVVTSCLLVAGGDAAARFERVEEDLDEIAVAVQLLVVATNVSPRGIGRDDVFHAAGADGATDMASIVAGVGNTGVASGLCDERRRDGGFVLLARGQLDVERTTLEIYDRVELGRKASTRASQSIASEPPFPPAAS